jgi:hypothetical protein
VPALVVNLSPAAFTEPDTIDQVFFEAGAQVRVLNSGTFAPLIFLKSLCIAASVELIERWCFVSDSWNDYRGSPECSLETVTFERGSRLHRIERSAFIGCYLLRSLCLPASIEEIEGGAFSECGLCSLQIERGNRRFRVRGSFLMDFDDVCLLHYLRADLNPQIPSETDGFFDRVGAGTSSFIQSRLPLYSVTVPASVTSIGPGCFISCYGLIEITFEAGSKLTDIAAEAFNYCTHLKVLALPSSVEHIGTECLTGCMKLETVVILPDSRLARLDEAVFSECEQLSSLFLPPSVESIGEQCFEACKALRTLSFGSPSRLETLMDVPPCWPGVHAIPDSVKKLGLWPDPEGSRDCVLAFGAESMLESIGITSHRPPQCGRCFVQISSRGLKRIRSGMEFKSN